MTMYTFCKEICVCLVGFLWDGIVCSSLVFIYSLLVFISIYIISV